MYQFRELCLTERYGLIAMDKQQAKTGFFGRLKLNCLLYRPTEETTSGDKPMKTPFMLSLLSLSLLATRAQAVTAPITPASIPGNATVINFETDPLGNPVARGQFAGNIWASKGVTF